ncbi:hypothetical protein ACIBF5_16315 [Micromonospora sp. NPDC050417]|uniref:hypothetical protein n=1 Tax=Micromonospora sp. NPDC050417 TaxID=3364280 RepID=UPI003789D797
MSGGGLGKHVDDLGAAVEAHDDERFFEALQGIARATPQSRPDEVQAALGKLVPVLAQIPYGMGADLAQPPPRQREGCGRPLPLEG